MAAPNFILKRGRDVSRETMLAELVRTALANLNGIDELAYEATIAELSAAGLPTSFVDGVMPRNASSPDARFVEYILEYVKSKLLTAGSTYRGVMLVDTAVSYVAKRGEFILADGAVATAVTLPNPKLLVNRDCTVTVKMQGGVGPCVVAPATGTIDGAANQSLVIDQTNLIFKVVAGPEGGAQLDTTGANAGDTVVVRGVTFTFAASITTPFQWNTADNLATAINTQLGTKVYAQAQGDILIVVTKTSSDDYTKSNADLLTEGYTVSRTGFVGDWTKVGGAALDDAGQLNITGDGIGAEYKLV